MPTAQSFADKLRSWEKALAGYLSNAEEMASAEPQRQALEQFLAKARELKNQQEYLTGVKQQLTKDIDELMKNGDEAARRLRAAAKSLLGTKDERLLQFDAMPIRPRTRNTATEEEPPEGEPTPPAPAPEAAKHAAEGEKE